MTAQHHNDHPKGASLPGAGAVHHIMSDISHCKKGKHFHQKL
jgi:hypothetical protein